MDGLGVAQALPNQVNVPLRPMGDTQIKDLVTQIPAGRRGLPKESGRCRSFFASDESAFTVGSELIIDGGMSTL
jgi:NAD(P)-dependent dehydrogenase (short-subunit alcohol dehydrogenase family)